METTNERLTRAAWDYLLARLAALDPDLYPVAYWLHVAGEIDLDDRQIVEFLRALVRAGAI